MMNEEKTAVRIGNEREAAKEKPAVIWSVIPLLDNEFPGIVFNNAGGTVTAGHRTFGRFEVIDDFRLGDSAIVRRPIVYVQRVCFELAGKPHTSVFKHRTACGWRCLGIEPILEIESLITEERWWFAYGLHSSGEWMWSRMTPTTDKVPVVHTLYQLPRVRMLCLYAGLLALYYFAATCAAVGAFMHVSK